MHDRLINSDQFGFLKGQNTGTNIRIIMIIIEYTELNDLPGSIVLIEIEN